MKKRGYFICFSGIDGSGKTTLAKRLENTMQNVCIDFKYKYSNYEPFIIKLFKIIGKLLFLKERDSAKNYQQYCNGKRKSFKKHSFLTWLYRSIHFIDYFLQILFKISIPLTIGRNIISDRYFYDVIINYSFNYNYTFEKIDETIKSYLRFFPKPDLLFFIEVPEDVAFKRKDDTPTLEYLKDRKAIYRELSKKYSIPMLDGTTNLDNLLNKIGEQAIKNYKHLRE